MVLAGILRRDRDGDTPGGLFAKRVCMQLLNSPHADGKKKRKDTGIF